jgi:hypothetical protein
MDAWVLRICTHFWWRSYSKGFSEETFSLLALRYLLRFLRFTVAIRHGSRLGQLSFILLAVCLPWSEMFKEKKLTDSWLPCIFDIVIWQAFRALVLTQSLILKRALSGTKAVMESFMKAKPMCPESRKATTPTIPVSNCHPPGQTSTIQAMRHSRDSLNVEQLMEKIWTLEKLREATVAVSHKGRDATAAIKLADPFLTLLPPTTNLR